MFDWLRGRLEEKKPTHVVVNVGGHGYRVEVPLSTFKAISLGEEVTLFTWLRITEEAIKIYGFKTEKEREIFLQLVQSVPALGPVKAIGILSNLSTDEFLNIVEKEDISRLKSIKGIGEKLATRMIVELKSKLPDIERKKVGLSSKMKDVTDALVTLGYSRKEALDAVQRIGETNESVEDVVKKILVGA